MMRSDTVSLWARYREHGWVGDLPEAARAGAAGALLLCGLALVLGSSEPLTKFFLGPDIVVLATASTAMWILTRVDLPRCFGTPRLWGVGFPAVPPLVAAATAAVAVLLQRATHAGFPLSYDEVMAEFDARIFESGRLLAPVAAEWRGFVPALAPHFVLPVAGHAMWSSDYLPVNAMLRAAFAAIGAPILTGPFLAGIAVVAAAAVARRLWPARPDAAVVAALLLASSPQVLVTAATSYAMSAHLAFNLVWLWSFLRGGRVGHAGAIATGFFACGLHQVVFHPLFVLPFLFGLAKDRRWATLSAYVAGYAAAGLFWISYRHLVLAGSDMSLEPGTDAGATALHLLRAFDLDSFGLMAANLVRFAAWQSPMLIPSAILAWPAIRRGDGQARPLAAGLLLTTAVMLVLMPYQGHGWGYRYLHGLIGNAALIGVEGWVAATQGLEGAGLLRARRIVAAGTLLGLLIVGPIQAAGASRFAAPAAIATAEIAGMDADVVLVDDRGFTFGTDLVRNAPDLSNRPKIMLMRLLAPKHIAILCRRGTVALFEEADAARAGYGVATLPRDPAWDILRATAKAPSCSPSDRHGRADRGPRALNRIGGAMAPAITKDDGGKRGAEPVPGGLASLHAFVVPAYGDSPFLDGCLRSLRGQRLPSRILITTSTPSAHIDAVAGAHGVPVVVNPVRGGIAVDWNFALDAADARFVTLAHQDDLYAAEFLSATLDAFARHRGALCFTGYDEIDNAGAPTSSKVSRVKHGLSATMLGGRIRPSRRRLRAFLSLGNPLPCSSVTLDRASLPGFAFSLGYDSNLDWDAWLRLLDGGERFLSVRERLVGRRHNPLTATSRMIADGRRRREDEAMFKRLWPSGVARAIAALYRWGY